MKKILSSSILLSCLLSSSMIMASSFEGDDVFSLDGQIVQPQKKLTPMEKFYKSPCYPELSDEALKDLGIDPKYKDKVASFDQHLKKMADELGEESPEQLLEKQGMLYAHAAHVIAYTRKALYCSEYPDLEGTAFLAGERFYKLAKICEEKGNFERALELYCVGLEVLRLPIHSFPIYYEEKRFEPHKAATALLGENCFAGIEKILLAHEQWKLPVKNPTSNPYGYHYFSPSQSDRSDLLAVTIWRLNCLRWACSAKDQTKGIKDGDFIHPLMAEAEPLFKTVIALACKEAEAKDGIQKAQSLEIARNQIFHLFQALIKWDKSRNSEDLSLSSPYLSQFIELSERAAAEFMDAGLRLFQSLQSFDLKAENIKGEDLSDSVRLPYLLNQLTLEKAQQKSLESVMYDHNQKKIEAVNYYLNASHLLMTNVINPTEHLHDLTRSWNVAQKAINCFGEEMCKKAGNFYMNRKAPNVGSQRELGSLSLVRYIQDSIYNTLRYIFKEQHPKDFTIKEEQTHAINVFLEKYPDEVKIIGPEYAQALRMY